MIRISTDGSYSLARGAGGWAAIIRGLPMKTPCPPDHDCGELHDLPEDTPLFLAGGMGPKETSNRAELRAVIVALNACKGFPFPILVTSDSQYVVATMNNGWKKRFNKDLWELLDQAREGQAVTFVWAARNSTPDLKECDRLAREQTEKAVLDMASSDVVL